MSKVKLFDINLYNESPECFEQRVIRKRAKEYLKYKQLHDNPKGFDDYFKRYISGFGVFYEDYSIGNLEVIYENGNLIYNVKFYTSKKLIDKESYDITPYKMPLFTNKKHYRREYNIRNIYSNISGMKNCEILKILKKDLDDISKKNIFQKIYFDRKNFDNLCKCIDFNKYIGLQLETEDKD